MFLDYTKKIFKHSLIYGSGEILVKVVAFLLIPIYTRYFDPNEYGVVQLLIITSSLITIILQFGLGSALFKSVIYNPEGNIKEIYSTAFHFIFITSFLILSVFFFNANHVSRLILGDTNQAYALKLIYLTIFFRNITQVTLTKLRIENRSLTFSLLLFIQFTIKLVLNIYFVVVVQSGIIGIIYADLITSIFFSIILLIFIVKELKIVFSLRELKDMLEFGLPIIPGNIAIFVLNMSNRYFLKHFSNMDQVGLFSLAYQFSMIMYLTVFAFQRGWASIMFHIAKEKNAKEIFAKNFTYFIFITGFIVFGVSIFARELLILIADPKYLDAYKIIPLLCASNFFYGIFFYTAVGINIKKKTYYQTLAVVTGSLCCLLLNYLLIPEYGMMGAAIANFVSFMIMSLMAAWISNRFFPIPYEKKNLFSIGMIFLIGFLISLFVREDHLLRVIAIKFALFMVAILLVVVFTGIYKGMHLLKVFRS